MLVGLRIGDGDGSVCNFCISWGMVSIIYDLKDIKIYPFSRFICKTFRFAVYWYFIISAKESFYFYFLWTIFHF